MEELIKYLQENRDNKDIPTKQQCKEINIYRKSIDGKFDESCFCSRSYRRSFLKSFLEWYEKNEKK